jgi:uncharacterized RDD family membrane protein YckC
LFFKNTFDVRGRVTRFEFPLLPKHKRWQQALFLLNNLLKIIMEEILDRSSHQQTTDNVKYGGFWSRFGALLLDGLILAPISFGITYFNITSWKSSLLLFLISVIAIAYKPFMEFTYGATLGKMVLKLRVTNTNLEKANLAEILLRNVFHIVPQLVTLLLSIGMIYNNPDFEAVDGWGDYTVFISQFSLLQYINLANGLITIVDAIMLATDEQKRSLHDRIGGTLVIDQS